MGKCRRIVFDFFLLVPHSPATKKRGPRLNLRMKSVSLDSPDVVLEEPNYMGSAHPAAAGGSLYKSMPKVIEPQINSSNAGGNVRRSYGTWVNVLKSRMAAQMANNSRIRRVPPSSMGEFGTDATTKSAPASYNHCNSVCQKKSKLLFVVVKKSALPERTFSATKIMFFSMFLVSQSTHKIDHSFHVFLFTLHHSRACRSIGPP